MTRVAVETKHKDYPSPMNLAILSDRTSTLSVQEIVRSKKVRLFPCLCEVALVV